MRAPSRGRSRLASVTGVGRPAYDDSKPSSSAWKAGSTLAFCHSASSWSSAATSASGTKRPPYGPKWPVGSGPAAGAVMSLSGAGPGRGVRADGDQFGDRCPRVAVGHEPLADQHGVCTGGGVGEKVVRTAHSGFGDLDDGLRDHRDELREQLAVDVQGPKVAR